MKRCVNGLFADTCITVTEFAKRIGVTHVALSPVLNGKASALTWRYGAQREE